MKVRSSKLSNQEKIQTLDALYTAASVIKGRDSVKHFLRDLLTESERIMLGRRILIARALLSGYSYNDISAEMGVGKDTIARVDQWLSNKSAGYEEVIEKMRKEMKERSARKTLGELSKDDSLSGQYARLKKKYPLHFLLFPWPKKYKDNL